MQAATFPARAARAARGGPVAVRAAQSVTGKVVSTAAAKTVIVEVDRYTPHPLYAKRIRKTKRYAAHDEAGVAAMGDTVRLAPCPPVSKTKRFAVAEVVTKSTL